MTNGAGQPVEALEPLLVEQQKKFVAAAPPEVAELVREKTKALIDTGIAERALRQGEQAPDFALPDHRGNEVKLSDLLAGGPAVVAFYRGSW